MVRSRLSVFAKWCAIAVRFSDTGAVHRKMVNGCKSVSSVFRGQGSGIRDQKTVSYRLSVFVKREAVAHRIGENGALKPFGLLNTGEARATGHRTNGCKSLSSCFWQVIEERANIPD
jgi:hypothetical protein